MNTRSGVDWQAESSGERAGEVPRVRSVAEAIGVYPMIVDFVEFVVSGQFGDFTGGAFTENIIAAIGTPEAIERSRRTKQLELLYNDLECRLYDDTLVAISLRFENRHPKLPESIVLERFPEAEDRNVKAVESILLERGIAWKEDDLIRDEFQFVYVTDQNVELVFDVTERLDKVVAVFRGRVTNKRGEVVY